MEDKELVSVDRISRILERIRAHQLKIVTNVKAYPFPLSIEHSLVLGSKVDQPAYAFLLEFLKNPQCVGVLLGDAGSGKTTLFHQIIQHCWQNPDQYMRRQANPLLPLFLSLANWKDSIHQHITDYLISDVGLELEDIEQLRESYTCLIVLDAFELSQWHNLVGQTNHETTLGWQLGQLLVNCRADYFMQGEESLNHFISQVSTVSITELYLRPLLNPDIHLYLQADTNYCEAWVSYLQDNPSLESLTHNPLFLTLIRDYLATHSPFPSLAEVYQQIFQQWFQHQNQRLEETGLLKDYEGDFIEHSCIYTHVIALKLNELHTESICFENDPFTEESAAIKWERFFSSEVQTYLVRQACPWQLSSKEALSFYHQDIVHYFANLTNYELQGYLLLPFIHGDEGVEELSQLLDCEVFAANSNKLNHLTADSLVGDISKEDYFRLVYLSAVNEKFARIAANAITILNCAQISFSLKNLSKIHIPHANLSDAIFDGTNLAEADLQFANMRGVWIRNANLTKTNLDNVSWGELVFVPYKDTQIISVVSSIKGVITNTCYTPNGRFLIIVEPKNLYIINSEDGQLAKSLSIDKTRGLVAFKQNSCLMAIGAKYNTIYVLDLDDINKKPLKVELESEEGEKLEILDLAFNSGTGNLIVLSFKKCPWFHGGNLYIYDYCFKQIKRVQLNDSLVEKSDVNTGLFKIDTNGQLFAMSSQGNLNKILRKIKDKQAEEIKQILCLDSKVNFFMILLKIENMKLENLYYDSDEYDKLEFELSTSDEDGESEDAKPENKEYENEKSKDNELFRHLTFDNCNKFIAAVRMEGEIYLWSLASNNWDIIRNPFMIIKTISNIKVLRLVFNNDATILAAITCNNMVYLWNVDTKRLINILPLGGNYLKGMLYVDRVENLNMDAGLVTFHPKMDVLLTVGGYLNLKLKIWLIDKNHSNSRVASFKNGKVYGMEFSSDGARIAVARINGSISLYDINEGALQRNLESGSQTFTRSVNFSNNDNYIISNDAHGLIEWSLETQEQRYLLKIEEGDVHILGVSHNNKFVLLAKMITATQEVVKLYLRNLDTLEEYTLAINCPGIEYASFSPNSQYLAHAALVQGASEKLNEKASPSRDDSRFGFKDYLADNSEESLYDSPNDNFEEAANKEEESFFSGVAQAINATLGINLLANHEDSKIKAFRLACGEMYRDFTKQKNEINNKDTPEGHQGHSYYGEIFSTLLSLVPDPIPPQHRLFVKELSTSKSVSIEYPTEPFGRILCLFFSNDGCNLVAGDSNHFLYKWDMRTRALKDKFRLENYGILGVGTFSSDDQFLAIGTNPGTIYIHGASTFKCLLALEGMLDLTIRRLAWRFDDSSNTSSKLVVGTDSGVILCWQINISTSHEKEEIKIRANLLWRNLSWSILTGTNETFSPLFKYTGLELFFKKSALPEFIGNTKISEYKEDCPEKNIFTFSNNNHIKRSILYSSVTSCIASLSSPMRNKKTTNREIHNSLIKKGFFKEKNAIRKMSYRFACTESRTNYRNFVASL